MKKILIFLILLVTQLNFSQRTDIFSNKLQFTNVPLFNPNTSTNNSTRKLVLDKYGNVLYKPDTDNSSQVGNLDEVTTIGSVTDNTITIGGLSINTNTPEAIVDINSNDSGILIPRLTTTQRNLINAPIISMLIYNTTINRFEYYNENGEWVFLFDSNYEFNLQNVVSNGNTYEFDNKSTSIGAGHSVYTDISKSTQLSFNGLFIEHPQGSTNYAFNGLAFNNIEDFNTCQLNNGGLFFIKEDSINLSAFNSDLLSFQNNNTLLGSNLNANSLTFSDISVDPALGVSINSNGKDFNINNDDYPDGFFNIDFLSKVIRIGDYTNTNNGTHILLDDSTSSFDIQASGGSFLNGNALISEEDVSYYEDEVKTNARWFNKPIYRKVISYTFDNTGLEVFIPHSIIDFSLLIGGKIIYNERGNNRIVSLSYSRIFGEIIVSSTEINIENINNIVDDTIFIVLEYTKTTD
jgi:hypothetical protein